MPENGNLEKMLILAYETSTDAETGGREKAKDSFEALINPESYTLEYKVKTAEGQGQGTSGVQQKFAYTMPDELTFEFLFDNTGIIDSKPNKEGVYDNVNHFRQILTQYQGSTHEPYHLKLVWGNLLFKGRAVEVSVTYKLFNSDGQPIRAIVKAKFKGSIEEKKRVAQEYKRSPDLTHVRKVKIGDTLPLMCYQIYGDPKYYLQVAQANALVNFRNLVPGTDVIFPPLAKTTN
jgi:hypothetical protein